jgi:hypothetical protein
LGGDPDDIQSLYRLIHSSDILKIEGIVSVTGPGSRNAADKIQHWVQRLDVEHLRARGHTELMSEAGLLAGVKQGATRPGAPRPSRGTEGSAWIISRARARTKKEPLWVLGWGSATDIAQALHDDPSIAPRIRICYIGSSNTVHDPESRDYIYNFMKNRAPDLWWIEDGILPKLSHDTFRGVYLGGKQDGEWSHTGFITTNIRGHGSTHDGLFPEKCGDAFPRATSPEGVLKEGDSPTFLYLLSPVLGGVGNVDDPTQESWGGQFRRPEPDRFPNYYTDLDASPEICQATISKWRAAYLGYWKERWDWYA